MLRTASLLAVLGAAAARPGYLAAPLSYNKSTYATEIDPGVLVSSDWDAVNVLWDAYGVPWASFISQAPLPAWWEDRLNRTVAAVAKWQLPVVLTLGMGSGPVRSCPAMNATDRGTENPLICQSCFDYNVVTNPLASFFRQGYANFVLYMAARFEPAVLAYAIDLNRVAEGCPEQWGSHVDFANQVYATLKNFNPKLSVFPSLSHESIMGVNDGQPCKGQGGGSALPPATLTDCVNSGLATVSELQRDAFAVSVSPTSTQLGNGAWQLWYMTVVLDALDAKDAATVAVTSYGYDSVGITVNVANGTIAAAAAPSASSTATAAGAGAAAVAAAAAVVAPAPAPGVVAAVTAAESAASAPSTLRGAAGASPTPTPYCTPIAAATITDSADFFAYLVDLTARYNFAFLSFYSARDLLPSAVISSCPCKPATPGDSAYCTFLSLYRQVCTEAGLVPWACEATLKVTGSMGVRDTTGATKGALYTALQAARAATEGDAAMLHPLLTGGL